MQRPILWIEGSSEIASQSATRGPVMVIQKDQDLGLIPEILLASYCVVGQIKHPQRKWPLNAGSVNQALLFSQAIGFPGL